MDREAYLNEVISLVKNKAAKREIRNELSCHIDDRMAYYLDSGYDEAYAEEQAIKQMGDADEVAKSMQKLHNNTIWLVLTAVFGLLFVAGLVIADVKMVNFAIINMVDFEGVEAFPCVVSVLTFLSLALCFSFAKKSQSSIALALVGFASIISPVVSCYALIPFGYQLVGMITDFPAAIFNDELFFDSGEILWHLDHSLNYGLPTYAYFALFIIAVLISLFGVVIGVVSMAYAYEIKNASPNAVFEKRVKKFASLVVILGVAATLGTCAELTYDYVKISGQNEHYELTLGTNLMLAREEFNMVDIPMTVDEVEALAKERKLEDFDKNDIQFGILNYYSNEAYNVQVSDFYNEDNIFDCKRIYTSSAVPVSKEDIEALRTLKPNSDIDELYEIISFANFEDYREIQNGEDFEVLIEFSLKDDYYSFTYINSKLYSSTFYPVETEVE